MLEIKKSFTCLHLNNRQVFFGTIVFVSPLLLIAWLAGKAHSQEKPSK